MMKSEGDEPMEYLIAFVVGGVIGVIGQLIFDLTTLTMGHIMVGFVVAGSVLTALGLYEPFVKIAGAGAFMPVSNFGYVLTKGVLLELRQQGIFGALSGVFEFSGAAIAAAIFFGFFFSALFRPKG